MAYVSSSMQQQTCFVHLKVPLYWPLTRTGPQRSARFGHLLCPCVGCSQLTKRVLRPPSGTSTSTLLLQTRASRGCGVVRSAHFKKTLRRSARVMKLAAAAGRRAAHRLYGTGLGPAIGYGAEVTGFSDPELVRVQAIGLRTVTPGNRGASKIARLALEHGVATDFLASAALFRFAKRFGRASTPPRSHFRSGTLRSPGPSWPSSRAHGGRPLGHSTLPGLK